MLKLILILCPFILLLNCQQSSPSLISNTDPFEQIIGGQPVQPNHLAGLSTVGIYLPVASDQVAMICTGLLTHGNRVITAAHCLTQITKQLKISDFELSDYVLIGFGLSVAKNLENTKTEFSRIKRAYIHPKFNRALLSSHADIALIDLLDLPPSNAKAADIGDFDQFQQQSALFDIYGLGHKAFVIDFSSKEMRRVTLQMKPQNTILFSSHSTWTKGLCDGDSGAPVFVQNLSQNIAVGIASRAGAGCIGEITFVKLYPFIDWIRQDLSN